MFLFSLSRCLLQLGFFFCYFTFFLASIFFTEMFFHLVGKNKYEVSFMCSHSFISLDVFYSLYSPEPALDFGSERGSEKEQWQTYLRP